MFVPRNDTGRFFGLALRYLEVVSNFVFLSHCAPSAFLSWRGEFLSGTAKSRRSASKDAKL
jgi:hypothetical protein